MAQFDPNRPPMSLSESEELLKRSGDWEATKAGWSGMFGELQLLAVVLGWLAVVVLALWAAAAFIGPMAAGILGFIVAIIWLGRRS